MSFLLPSTGMMQLFRSSLCSSSSCNHRCSWHSPGHLVKPTVHKAQYRAAESDGAARNAEARDVVAVVEEDAAGTHMDAAAHTASGAAATPVQGAGKGSSSSSSSSTSVQEPKYKALLAIILKLIDQEQAQPQQQLQQQQQQQHQQQPQAQRQQPQQQHSEQQQARVQPSRQQPQRQPQADQPNMTENQQQQQPYRQEARWQRLEAFLRCQPTATSIPFIAWLADMEATATGPTKSQLAQLCEVLVLLREQQEVEAQEVLYADTLRLLSGGVEQAVALMSADPRQYSLALAEGLTGQPPVLQGYGAVYDALLQVAPAAALTPEAVAQGHELAEELGADLSSRRKSTVAAMLGRVQLDSLSQEQQAALLGPSPAARILDLLLSLPGSSDRLALLPDCFTAPEADAGGDAAAAKAAGDEATDELWCTPMQLLNEIDRRLNAAAAAGADSKVSSSTPGALLSAGGSGGSAAAALPAAGTAQGTADADVPGVAHEEAVVLRGLRQHIQGQWLDSLPQR